MKDIYIFSNSLIVNELLKLIFKNRNETTHFCTLEDCEKLRESMVIVDDSIEELSSTIEMLKSNRNSVILLGETREDVDYTVAKPFLPEDIEAAIANTPLPKKSTAKIETKVLDPDEIAYIKSLMSLSEEEVKEEPLEVSPLAMLKSRESFKVKGKEAKELLLDLNTLSAKELKGLLKKSKVTIKVNFKKDEDA